MFKYSYKDYFFAGLVLINLNKIWAAMAEWLRRLTRNQMGLPAQVQILFAAKFFI